MKMSFALRNKELVSVDNFFKFIEARYEITKKKKANKPQPWTDDYILANAKINNIHREDDKTSVFIHKKLKTLDKANPLLIFSNILMMRFTNRIDVINAVFPISIDTQPNEILERIKSFGPILSSAYRLHSRVGQFGIKRVRDIFPYAHTKAEATLNAILETDTIHDAVIAANKAYGGGALFYLYQCIMDFGTIYPKLINMNSMPYIGAGAIPIHEHIGYDAIELSKLFRKRNKRIPLIKPYNMENALCEYRKYVNILATGKVTKRYKRSVL